MTWAFYLLPLVLPAVAAVGARPLGDRVPPRAATWLLVGGGLVLAASSSAVLAFLALYAVFRIPPVAALGHMSGQVIGQASPASLPVAVAAGAALAITASTGRARDLPGTGQVVVTQEATADAYTLPGWPCRIVITDGMLRALREPERRVLLAHERTHAARLHYLFMATARLAAATNPLLHPVAAEAAYTVERWADEDAAADTGDRSVAATAIARAALAAKASAPRQRPTPRDGRAGTLGIAGLPWTAGRRPGPVPRRVAALLLPPPRLRLLLVTGAVGLVLLSAASALGAAASLHHFVEYAQQPRP